MDYREFVAAHRAAGADITVAALPCAEEQAQAFGLMKIDDTGRCAARHACVVWGVVVWGVEHEGEQECDVN